MWNGLTGCELTPVDSKLLVGAAGANGFACNCAKLELVGLAAGTKLSRFTRLLFSPKKSSGSFFLPEPKLSGVEFALRLVLIGARRAGARGSRLKELVSVRFEMKSNSSSTMLEVVVVVLALGAQGSALTAADVAGVDQGS